MIIPTNLAISGVLNSQLDIRDKRKVQQLSAVLESSAQHFAQNPTAREEAGTDPKLWTGLRQLWRELVHSQLSHSSRNDDDISGGRPHIQRNEEEYTATLRSFCMALAKFTRNIVAGVPENQLRAFDSEPDIRRLLHYYTSWTVLQGDRSKDAARLLAQVLSNTVTSNDILVQTLWELYMNLPEEEAVLIRLLAIDDHKTLLTTLVFVLNCIHQSTTRKQLMIKSNVGIRICIGLLDKMVMLYEAEKGSDGARAFDVGYAIISEFIESGLLPELYKRFLLKSEVITPHQTTLLKLLDSYLLSTQPHASDTQISDILRIHQSLSSFLAKRFFMLSEYAQRAIHRSLGMTPMKSSKKSAAVMHDSSGLVSSDSESSSELGVARDKASALRQINMVLPKACEALVLVTQCIVTVCLEAEEQQIRLENRESTYDSYTDVKKYFNRKKYQESGLVESLIDLLSLLDVFLPRINFGKPVGRDGTPAQLTATDGVDPTVGFSFLKRDLVRLLGVLCHSVKSVQDRAREAGGLPVIMNMCVVDERNPYLREHAIFTMRNLLKDNIENQRFVDSVKPAKEWAADGTLKSRVKLSKIK